MLVCYALQQFTDVVLDLESKQAMWTVKEKEHVEANLRLSNCHDELTKVSFHIVTMCFVPILQLMCLSTNLMAWDWD